jgi:hypothetical protein
MDSAYGSNQEPDKQRHERILSLFHGKFPMPRRSTFRTELIGKFIVFLKNKAVFPTDPVPLGLHIGPNPFHDWVLWIFLDLIFSRMKSGRVNKEGLTNTLQGTWEKEKNWGG